ncbi:hypothetical protein PUR71_16725 [Streptomyces sp. SP17BM10]|uniref:hypothetical protein n=1 Tax=Streptomyces sp. SP17BM10 TaxID=3002530 RepID=UPI002E795D57|nr:hypothetical protein [Streptomyces sp. SP17BM10]MEE1784534.1 hypothetical protein [Streptomyces sp. SP17BM10]
MTLAIDVGTRFVRLAHVRPDRLPALAELPEAVPAEGVPVPAGQDPARTLAAACAAFRERYGRPAQVVLVAPEAMPTVYPDRIAEAFGRTTPVVELRPATAVLALLRHNGRALEGTWAVCALGTTAIEVSVCVAARRSVGVRRFVRHTPEGGLGAAFDSTLLGGAATDDAALAALRAARDAPGSAARWERVIARAERHPARYDDMAVLWVDGREVPAGTARHALAVLREQVGHAAAEAGLEDLPVVAVGGPARLAAVRRAAAGAGRAVELPAAADPALAAVLGAALVAAGLVDPADRYPYEVLIGARRVHRGRLTETELTLCGPGRLVPGGATVFAERAGRRVAVGGAGERPREAEVRVRDADGGPAVRVGTVTLPASRAGERFHIGIAMAAAGPTRLVLRPAGGSGEPHEYPLGELPGVLEGDHH